MFTFWYAESGEHNRDGISEGKRKRETEEEKKEGGQERRKERERVWGR